MIAEQNRAIRASYNRAYNNTIPGKPLSAGEMEVWAMSLTGRSMQQIADELGQTTRAIEGKMFQVLKKLGYSTRLEMMGDYLCQLAASGNDRSLHRYSPKLFDRESK